MMLEFENLPRGDLIRLHAHLAGGHVRPSADFPFETSGPATRGNAVDRSALDCVGGGNNPRKSMQLRADPPRPLSAVAPSRREEMTVHPFIQCLRDIACLFAAFLLVSVTGIGIAFAMFVLLFVSF